MTRRRDDKAVTGWVNFPIDRIPSTGEGGTFVSLVVEPIEKQRSEEEFDDEWSMCAGAENIYLHHSEVLIGDDRTVAQADDDATCVENYHFPYLCDEERDEARRHDVDRYISISYLAAITIGTTGWSPEAFEWTCTFEDLTDEGKKLYKQMQDLYGDHGRVVLLTWLDT